MEALMDAGDVKLAEIARRTKMPYRTLQEWLLRDELPESEKARAAWEKFKQACSPRMPEEDDDVPGPQHFPWITDEKSPHDEHDKSLIERLNAVEALFRDALEEMVVLRRDIAAASKRRKRHHS